MVAERRYRSASGAPKPASSVFSSRPQAMAHPMLRGAQVAATSGAAIRAVSAGLSGISAVGETAIQVGNWCPRRHPGTPRTRPEGAFSIHSKSPTEGSDKSPSKWMKALTNGNGTVELAQSSNANNNAQLAPSHEQNENAKLQNIICQQSNDTSKLLGIIEDLTSKINDLQQHMGQDLARTEEKLRAEYDNMLVNATLRINEEKDSQINLLKMQVAKFRVEDKNDNELKLEDVQKELQFQNQMYPQSPDKAKQAELMTRTAQQRNEDGATCYNMDSMADLCSEEHKDKYSDDQAKKAIQLEASGKQFIILAGGIYKSITDLLQDVGKDQRQRVLKLINAQQDNNTIAQRDHNTIGNDHKEANFDKLLNNLTTKDKRDARDDQSQAASTPPRTHRQIPDRNNDDNDGDEQWPSLFSVYKGNGDKGGDGGGDDEGIGIGTGRRRGDGNEDNDHGEFTLVNSRNIEMKKFSGEHNCKMIYLEFNDSQRELVGIKGKHGANLNKILTWAEQQGDTKITDTELEEMEVAVPKIWEYDRAIHASLKNWTDGEVKRFIKYEVNGGIDAWMKLYIEYIPLAQTRQDIILSEILELKPVTTKDVRRFLNRVEELRYKYNQCGGTPLGDHIIKRMLVKCVPREVMKPLALHLENAETFQQVRKLIMRQMHDELTGMLEGENTQPLYSIGQDSPKKEEDKEEEQAKTEEDWQKLEQEYLAALGQKGKGGKGGKGKRDNGKGKGYGECWNCGQQGHPSRECPVPGKLHGGVGNQPGTTVAFKGKGKGKGKRGKGDWRGKGWKGRGKSNGKHSLNLATESDYNAAWYGAGEEDNGEYDNYYNYDHSYNYAFTNNQQSSMHYSMMLTRSKRPIITGPTYFTTEMYDDEEDETEEEEENDDKGSKEEPNSTCRRIVVGLARLVFLSGSCSPVVSVGSVSSVSLAVLISPLSNIMDTLPMFPP